MQLTIGLIAAAHKIKPQTLYNVAKNLRKAGRTFGRKMNDKLYYYSKTEAAELVELSGRSRGWQRGKKRKPVTTAGIAKE
mgnify:CR=1 FL=1